MKKQIGQFKIDGDYIEGPHDYMVAKGNAKLDAILAGNDLMFNTLAVGKPESEWNELVVRVLQTDYAGWVGVNRFFNKSGIEVVID